MKYNKFIKMSNKSYLLVILCSILLLVGIFYFYIRGTYASFGGVSGDITITEVYSLTFHSNYPEDSLLQDMYIIGWANVGTECDVSGNQFPIPEGYNFIGWNSMSDGSGFTYGKSFTITENVEIYAMWSKVDINDDSSTNADTDIPVSPDDDVTDLPDDGESDEDLNDDDNKTEENDKPSLDNPSDENTDDDNSSDHPSDNDNSSDHPSDNDNSSDINIGTGNLGSGGTDTGSGGSGNNGNNNSSNSNGKPSNTGGNKGENNKTDNPVSKEEKLFYRFRYMNNNTLYSETLCKVLKEGDTCDLVLPGINPTKDGYVFSGWSLNKDCSSKDIITKTIEVNSSNTYYACYVRSTNNKTELDHFSVIISIITMWGVTITSIILLIKRFIKNNSKN